MKLYIPCTKPDASGPQTPVMVQDGFSWRVLFFGWFGLLTYGAWISALLAAAATMITLHVFMGFWSRLDLIVAIHAVLASFTAEIRLWEQRLNGRVTGTPIAAPSRDIALLRWMDQQHYAAPYGSTSPEFPCASS
ncbi:hypothetical protein [Gluconobacter oxydans]|uniref:DUF2628 domain-containing protein n=1 Tax=Gluconobacter oxydans TaxID=442 RepID=A0A149RWR0_GLUOY|nr:hypothetical protein [Gluconobacter oxydans]KXV18819.1 hypothetical protein AD934_06840 [Gluconobacter oxydans]